MDGTTLPRAPTLVAPLPSVSCSTRLSQGNPHPARLRLSVHSKPDESQKKAFQNKIRAAACVSRCRTGPGALIPPHNCGSDTGASLEFPPRAVILTVRGAQRKDPRLSFHAFGWTPFYPDHAPFFWDRPRNFMSPQFVADVLMTGIFASRLPFAGSKTINALSS